MRALEFEEGSRPGTPASPSTSVSTPSNFDISKHILLVPPFREWEVESYFNAFECMVGTLKWPKELWSLLLQCKLVRKAQEVCSSLSIDKSLDYETQKKSELQAYELVLEAYRQKFRNFCKAADQTFMEFAQEKSGLFDKWCGSCKVKILAELRTLNLLEEFKKCLPERIVTYLNDCHGFGHLIAACQALKRKEAWGAAASGGVGLIKTSPSSVLPPDVGGNEVVDIDPQFSLFPAGLFP